jgi:hypothetical protein
MLDSHITELTMIKQ